MKARIKWTKTGVLKFIGHLDVQRYFQKAMRRADIDIKYSEGYSPHQIMSFAYPLGVGVTTEGDYLDIEVNTTKNSAEAVKDLNEAMAEGFKVTEYRLLPDGAKAAMTAVAAAGYRVDIREGYGLEKIDKDVFNNAIKSFYIDADRIDIIKKTKKTERAIDLKPLIYGFSAESDDDGRVYFKMLVSSGSEENIKPALVMEHFVASMGLEFNEFSIMIHRTDTFTTDEEGKLVTLGAVGEDIL